MSPCSTSPRSEVAASVLASRLESVGNSTLVVTTVGLAGASAAPVLGDSPAGVGVGRAGEQIGSSGLLRTALTYVDGVEWLATSRRDVRSLVFVLVTALLDGR